MGSKLGHLEYGQHHPERQDSEKEALMGLVHLIPIYI